MNGARLAAVARLIRLHVAAYVALATSVAAVMLLPAAKAFCRSSG